MTKYKTNEAVLPTKTDEVFKLKIDRDTQKFFIDGLESHGMFDSFIMRPLDILNKIKAYDDDFKVSSESTLYRELKEARDSRGHAATDKEGKVCGRIVWKSISDKLSEEGKTENKAKAKFYAFLFGIATVEGKEPVLVDMQIGGSKFMEIINLMKKIKEEKKEYNKAEIKIKAYPSTEFDWPELEFMPDFSRELPIAGLEPLLDTLDAYIDNHNEGIDKKVEKFKNKGTSNFKRSTSFKRK